MDKPGYGSVIRQQRGHEESLWKIENTQPDLRRNFDFSFEILVIEYVRITRHTCFTGICIWWCPKPKSKSSRTKAGQTYVLWWKRKEETSQREKKEKQVFRKEEKMANQNNRTFSLSLLWTYLKVLLPSGELERKRNDLHRTLAKDIRTGAVRVVRV